MPTSQRAALGRLLKRQDPEILDWLFNRTRPDEPEFRALIDAILEFKVKKKSQTPEIG
jgi:succinate dehydrogenase flavin-adding protein (antitoxin of CptAB toxin-antitoxin module)